MRLIASLTDSGEGVVASDDLTNDTNNNLSEIEDVVGWHKASRHATTAKAEREGETRLRVLRLKLFILKSISTLILHMPFHRFALH